MFHRLVMIMFSLMLLPITPLAQSEPPWKQVQLPAFDFTVMLPDDWPMLEPADPQQASLSFLRTGLYGNFGIFARYHLSLLPRDPNPYELAVPGTPYTAPFRLANGQQATLVTGERDCRMAHPTSSTMKR